EEDYNDDNKSDEVDEHDRRNFKAIRTIPRKAIEAFVLGLVNSNNDLKSRTCRLTLRKEGSFHHAVFLQVALCGEVEQEFVLKIPAHGTPELWKEGDACMLRGEASLMQHIRHHTECPVPEVIAFDDSVSNPIGAPYILMKRMSGVSALDMWLGQPYKTLKSGEEHMNADDPSPETERKRITFLRSLAHAMSHLQKLNFDEIGVPVFEEAEDKYPRYFGHLWRWHSKVAMQELTPIGPFDTSEEFFLAGLSAAWDPETISDRDPNDPQVLEVKGVRKVLEIVFASPPFAPLRAHSSASFDGTTGTEVNTSTKESFVLRHDDLDLQNILVDDEGNVTGIIDWDGCMSVPRCIGYTSLPTFLRRDWLPDHDMNRGPHMTWSLDRYRDLYAHAMKEYCKPSSPLADPKQTDAMFTRKSAIYQALQAAIHEDSDVRDIVTKLLREIPEFRHVDIDQLHYRLGQGWPAAERALTEKAYELLKP
ncbi:uncharacterized protein K460DRAFT_268296, partial [Cucurbitaria berberidis CBS 394.84]